MEVDEQRRREKEKEDEHVLHMRHCFSSLSLPDHWVFRLHSTSPYDVRMDISALGANCSHL